MINKLFGRFFRVDLVPLKRDWRKVLYFINDHWLVVVTLLGAAVAILVTANIQTAVTAETDQDAYLAELATFENIIFDEAVIEDIVKLTANEVDIRADLPENRDNPFLDF